MEAFAGILGGAAVFLLLAYVVRTHALRPAEARIRYLTSPQRDLSVERAADGKLLMKRDPSGITALSRFLSANGYAERWAPELDRAGFNIRPGEYFIVRLAIALAVVAIVSLAGGGGIAFIVSLPLAAIGYMLPAQFVKARIDRRRKKIESQLVETITLIANALRAGFAFPQGVDVAAKRVGDPMSVELNRMLLDINLGMDTEDALRAMNVRIQSDDLDMVITAILIQRAVGGNLAEVLESVTETMRDRERIQGEIKTMTSQQRLTGTVLSLWPITIAGLFFMINRDMMSLLWKEPVGVVMLFIWGSLTFAGIFTIRRILDIDV